MLGVAGAVSCAGSATDGAVPWVPAVHLQLLPSAPFTPAVASPHATYEGICPMVNGLLEYGRKDKGKGATWKTSIHMQWSLETQIGICSDKEKEEKIALLLKE